MLTKFTTSAGPVLIDLDKVITVVPYTIPYEQQIGHEPAKFQPHEIPNAVIVTPVTSHFVMETVEDIEARARYGDIPQ